MHYRSQSKQHEDETKWLWPPDGLTLALASILDYMCYPFLRVAKESLQPTQSNLSNILCLNQVEK